MLAFNPINIINLSVSIIICLKIEYDTSSGGGAGRSYFVCYVGVKYEKFCVTLCTFELIILLF